MKSNILVSVMIITRNRPDSLKRCVRSILENTFTDYEIVILDNGTDETSIRIREFIRESGHSEKIKYFRIEPKGFAALRQEAAERCEGTIVMSIDDDCVADSNAIKFIADRFASDNRIGVIGGNIDNIGFEADKKYKGRGKLGINGRFSSAKNIEDADVFGGANMSFRKKAFDEAGGYDKFFNSGLEEADLIYSIKEQGYKIVYEPNIKIFHYHVKDDFKIKKKNNETKRIYFFLKHFTPKNVKEWCQFFLWELKFVFNDLFLAVKDDSMFKKIKKVVIPRMLIPYIIIRVFLYKLFY